MKRRRFPTPGTAPATLVVHPDTQSGSSCLSIIEYGPDFIDERTGSELLQVMGQRRGGSVLWLNLDGLGDVALLKQIGEYFGLHPLALEDVVNAPQRPKLDDYEKHLFIVMQMVHLLPDEVIEFEQMSIFVGKDFLITVQEREGDVFDPVRKRLRTGRGYARSRGHDYLAYALIDSLVDFYYPVLEKLAEAIEMLEDKVLDDAPKNTVEQVHDMKQLLGEIRRAAWAQRELVSRLTHDDSGLIREETQIFLRDVHDHASQVLDLTETSREVAGSLIELYMSTVSLRTNEVMRVLTVVASIFIPLTFLAGIYGMNFDPDASPYNMPELEMRYGYPAFLLAMLLIAVGMVLYFRKRRWL